jgi:DNA-binding GntR family transcriptional regulator
MEKNKALLKPIRQRGALGALVYRQLKEAIIQGDFEPGTWLQEDQLTGALQTSRTPVREAISRLRSEGLIDVVPRKGAFIVALDDKELDDLFEAREIIETTFFRRSARRLSSETLRAYRDRLQTAAAEMARCHRDQATWEAQRRQYLQADRALHDKLIAAAGNRYWEYLYFNIRDRIELYGNRVSWDDYWFKVAIEDHQKILAAIIEKRLDDAREAMQLHIRHMHAGVTQRLNRLPINQVEDATIW